ncbi:MAG: DUF6364 family protein [Bacteroidota bacterium]
MKTKLTLTVRKNIIQRAKKIAKERNVSVSQLFEEAFEKDDLKIQKSDEQVKAADFLKLIEKAEPTETLEKSDKELIREYWENKYA